MDCERQCLGNFGRSCDAVRSERQVFYNFRMGCDAEDSEASVYEMIVAHLCEAMRACSCSILEFLSLVKLCF